MATQATTPSTKTLTDVENVDIITSQKQTDKGTIIKPSKLTIRQKKFVANKVAGQSSPVAYRGAGYKASTDNVARVESSKLLNKPNIQTAIDNALEHHGATPEFAIGRLKQIAEQSKELGASRLASKDILELHGWQRGERPSISVTATNVGFFGSSRTDTASPATAND